MASLPTAETLRTQAAKSGTESDVKVNQRKLVDKILARYSSDFVVFRELIQNADDAHATSFDLSILCHNTNSRDHFSERALHKSTITELRTSNNGRPFSKVDWERVAAIADGNVDVDSVGQFGVGFFSVFAYSDGPIITSGKEYLVFAWRNDHTLTTYRQKLSSNYQSERTSIIMVMKHQFLLHTSDEQYKSNDKKFEKKHDKSIPVDEIIPIIDLYDLKIFLSRSKTSFYYLRLSILMLYCNSFDMILLVLSFTKHIQQVNVTINGTNVFQVNKSVTKKFSSLKSSAKNPIFQIRSLTHSEQTFFTTNNDSLSLEHVSVQADVSIDATFHEMIRRSLKKSLPSQVSIQLLFAASRLSSKTNDVLHSLMPVKWDHDSLVPTGLIFIGFATHQTTGIGFHIQSHLIPTIERESLDMQDPYIAAWNRELLTFSGQIVRSIYDRIMLKNLSMVSDSRTAIDLLAPFAFQCTTPDQQIGMALLKGFLTSHDVLQVLVRQSLDDDSFALIPSSQAFLSTSRGLEEFLTLPLVPFELVEKGFFSQLKRTGVMRDISNQEIIGALTNEPISLSALVHLMNWLRKEHCNDKPFFNHVLSQTRFKESSHSFVISMTQIQYYDAYQISTKLPLPKNFLPASVACQFSTDDLKLHFSLNTCSLQHYLDFYLSDEQLGLFRNGSTSEDLLRFFCKYSSQLTESNWTTLTTKLSQIKCILTNQGMKFPKESYLPSTFVDENAPLIIFRLFTSSTDSHDDQSISTTFLKRIGCRMFNLRRLCKFGADHRALRTKSSVNPGMKEIVHSLLTERSNLSLNDLNALREERFLTGRTLQSTPTHKELYAAYELHFPFVAQKLNWPTLLIIDWIDIDRYSAEYAFLKEIGVRQVPELTILLERIIRHYQSIDAFYVSQELKFFAENFQTEYNNLTDLKKCERAFLPSIWPSKNNSGFFLMPPSETFTESNPLFPVLIDAVKKLFEDNFRIDTLGIKSKPTLSQAFDVLTKRRQSLLKSKTRASYIFKYMNMLEGRTVALIDKVSNLAFIPLFQGKVHFAKPTEVFVRSADQVIVKNDQENIDTEGLIDYVDFGSDANAFLTSINVLPFPTSPILAQLLLDRQQDYLAVKNDCRKSINERLKIYLHCLKYLAVLHIAQNDLLQHPIRARLEKEPWCLAYQLVSQDNGENNTCGQIVCPSEVYLNDDEQLVADLQPLCAPAEKLVTDLYHALGSRWLSESAQRVVFHTGKTNESKRTHHLRDLIQSRLEMLFVNNRGVSLPDVDRKKIDLIKNTLTVFETDGFECRVQFQDKLKKIKAFSNRSCALEVAKNRVIMYLRRDVETIEHFEVASELCRFVVAKQNEMYFDSVTNRLVVPLDTLKKRGIPVDRLMKTNESPITGPLVQNLRQQKKHKNQKSADASARVASEQSNTGNANSKRSRFWWLGFLYPPAWIRSRSRVEDQITQNTKHIESNLNVSYTPDFRSLPDLRSSTRMREIFSRNRPFNDAKLQQTSNEVHEIIESCTMHPEMNLTQYSMRFNAILFFFDKGVTVTDDMIYNAEQLSRIINNLATQVFQISVESFHMFRDIKSAFIAFNRSGSVFFNLRYFEQIFADELNQSHDSASAIEKIINFYYLVACHELSHNVYPAHDISFMNQMQWMAVKYMPAKERSVHQMLGHTVAQQPQRRVF